MVKLLVLVLVGGCSISGVDFTGKACPCPDDYVCDTTTQTCARSFTPGDDAQPDTGDGPQVTSCLSNPLTNKIYGTDDFADFATAWTAGGGMWSHAGSEAVQSNTMSSLAFLYHQNPVALTDMRLVATMHATSGGAGKAIELTLRVDAASSNMYHCNWEPEGGAFIIQRTDDINTGITLDDTVINTTNIPNYMITDPVTMEFQASGTTFTCCLRGITGASLTGMDATYSSGDAGLKTYQMAGGFSGFELYTP